VSWHPGGNCGSPRPDFAFLKALHESEKTDLQKAYLVWTHEYWLGSDPVAHPEMFVINNFFRAWGHKFIYETTLAEALKAAGFVRIQRCALNRSEDSVFCGLENESRMPGEFLNLESMVLEATKPERGEVTDSHAADLGNDEARRPENTIFP